jgi:hypothetical protein
MPTNKNPKFGAHYLKEWRKKNRQTHLESDKVFGNYLKRYGITPEEYREMLLSQDGRCAICGCYETSKGRTRLAVDHQHDSGQVRGLLCNSCNAGLGFLKDNEQILENALAYLKRWSCSKVSDRKD